VPRYRAQRPAGNPARRVRVLPAGALARTGRQSAGADDPDGADTAPLPALTGTPAPASPQPARLDVAGREPGGQNPAGPESGLPGQDRRDQPGRGSSRRGAALRRPSRGTVAGAIHGLVVTPWFAAATGIVIAASLWLYAPRPELTFPPDAIGAVHCAEAGCLTAAPEHSPGSLATSSGQQIVPANPARSRGAVHTDVHAHRPSAGLTVTYAVVSSQQGRFSVVITVTSRHAIRNWTLAFSMPGDQIIGVLGASWQATGSASGIASPGGSASAGGGQPPQGPGGGRPGSPAGHRHGHSISFMVTGTGQPAVPVGCSFDHASCSFTS